MENTTINNVVWQRVEGFMIAAELDPAAVASYLEDLGVLACLEWYERSRSFVSLILPVYQGKVGLLEGTNGVPTPGPGVDELTEKLAQKFSAEVRIGGAQCDRIAQDTQLPVIPKPENQVVRAVEISPIAPASVPLISAFERMDIGAYALGSERVAMYIAAEEQTGKAAEVAADTPLVSLQALSTGELRVVLDLTGDKGSDDWETGNNYVVYTWGMEYRFVYGKAGELSAFVRNRVQKMVGRAEDLYEIADALPGVSRNAVFDAALISDPVAGATAMIRAFGLPHGTIDFLKGRIGIAQVHGVVVHHARGLSNALGRTVDLMMEEPESVGSKIWDTYHTIAIERPWIVRTIASLEASLGATLLVVAIRSKGRSKGLRRLGGLLGVCMMIDSVAEVTLAKFLALRAARHRESGVGGN